MGLFGFGKQKPTGQTILLLDVESGSVGGALLRHEPAEVPKLFGETRINLPLSPTRDSTFLARHAHNATRNILARTSELGARLRAHQRTAHLGEVSRVAIFFAPPWGAPNLAQGSPDFVESFAQGIESEVAAHFNPLSSRRYTAAAAARHGVRTIFPHEESFLVCSITGETLELLLEREGQTSAHATVPLGAATVLRTLRSHGGLSIAEADSVLKLHVQGGDTPAAGALHAAARKLIEEFKQVSQALFAHGRPRSLYVLGAEPLAVWFAKALADSGLEELYPDGGTVRAVGTEHASPYVATHSERPDLGLLLDALFVDASMR